MANFEAQIAIVAVAIVVSHPMDHGCVESAAAAFSGSGAFDVHFCADEILFEDDVDDTGHRIGTVHCGSAVFQHFNTVDCVEWNIGNINERELRIIRQRVRCHPMSVDQNECRGGVETTQCDTAGTCRE